MRWVQIATFLSGVLVVVLLQRYRPQERLSDKIVFEFNEGFTNYSADTLKAMTFGYSRAASALLWLRFLEQTPPRKVEKNQVSWIYRDLDAITEIDPDFTPPYELGGIFLSVITEDQRGAEQIMLKGIKRFPDRWKLRYYLGYHYNIELKEPDKAGAQYLAGAKLPGAPYLLGVLAASYMDKTHRHDESVQLVESLLRDAKDPLMRARFEAKLKKLKEEK